MAGARPPVAGQHMDSGPVSDVGRQRPIALALSMGPEPLKLKTGMAIQTPELLTWVSDLTWIHLSYILFDYQLDKKYKKYLWLDLGKNDLWRNL